MNQRERLAICSSCINRKLDHEHGYVCGLTGRVADFAGTCKDYKLDGTVTDTIKIRTKDRPFVPLFDPVPEPEVVEARKKAAQKKAAQKKAAQKKSVQKKAVQSRAGTKKAEQKNKPSTAALKKVRKYQSFLYALLGGLLITATASLGWAYAAAVTGFNELYMAIGVGLLVGIAVRFFGAGIHGIFGFLAALLALAGSLLGHYLILSGFPEEVQLTAMARLPEYLKPELLFNTVRDSFVPLDLLFYGLAALLAYLLAIRRIHSGKMARLEQEDYKGAPALYWLRLPLILAGILIPSYYGYTLTRGDSGGYNTLYYESGNKMSEGQMRKGVKLGEWTSWYENGKIRNTGYYDEGQKDSLWHWYDESGILTGTGRYSGDLESGIWMHYFPDGTVSDSGSYLEGLKEGLWKHYHENGSLKYSIHYKAGEFHGEKILLSSSGDVVNVEFYENGVLKEKD